jgi:hypothetical protein
MDAPFDSVTDHPSTGAFFAFYTLMVKSGGAEIFSSWFDLLLFTVLCLVTLLNVFHLELLVYL